MLKKILISSLAIFFCFGVWGYPSIAGVKPSASCKSVGSTKIMGDKKLTCIRVGKALKWNSGVLLTAKSKSIKKISAAQEAQYLELLKMSFKKAREYRNPNPEFKIDIYSDLDPNSVEYGWIVNAQDNVVQAMAGLFSEQIVFSSVITKDASFARNAYNEIEKKLGVNLNTIFTSNEEVFKSCESECAYATGVLAKREYPVLTYVNVRSDITSKEVGAHEAFHVVQNSLMEDTGNLPCWIVEGQATFFGSAFADPKESLGSTLSMISQFGGPKSAGTELSKLESPSGWIDGGHGDCMDIGEYQVGRMANAYLIGKFGMKKNIEFLKKMDGEPADGKSWKRVFKENFKVSVAKFYSDVEPFLNWFFRNLSQIKMRESQ